VYLLRNRETSVPFTPAVTSRYFITHDENVKLFVAGKYQGLERFAKLKINLPPSYCLKNILLLLLQPITNF
jgi:hypothetical protein